MSRADRESSMRVRRVDQNLAETPAQAARRSGGLPRDRHSLMTDPIGRTNRHFWFRHGTLDQYGRGLGPALVAPSRPRRPHTDKDDLSFSTFRGPVRHVGRALRRPRPCIRGGPVSRSACGESSIDDVAAFWNRRGEDRWLVMRRGWTEWTSRQLRRLDAESNTRCRWRAADGATVLEALEALRDATTK
ncbi:hypothetical protein Purlil1_2330 [Purpureocillium lilacinum]|uniref:Uncharacterized protein n=1 Tax=Purpureocillium lilacinum TaxID=33203 RepID=A0ABR0CB43_PURLI|nr:hypothetical protein Purlil1_2330 [Purpureocillium lilacinum]